MQGMWVRSLGQENPLEKEMVTHSSILAWRIPWTEELGSPWAHKRVGHKLVIKQQQHVSHKIYIRIYIIILTHIFSGPFEDMLQGL